MKQVISASRRTDMPAWYFDRLAAAIDRGCIDVPHPFTGTTSRVSLAPGDVHTLVLWSKDFTHVLENRDLFAPYNLYFLFTINDMPALEPNVPPLAGRLAQAARLAALWGPERIAWRFDPVIFTSRGPLMDVDDFARIGGALTAAGITRVIASFLDLYGKVRSRIPALGLDIVEPPEDALRAYAARLVGAARDLGMTLDACSESLLVEAGARRSSCIDGALLGRLAGERASVARDTGQRTACGCTRSRDIGSYDAMPCPAGCRYCYANPVIPAPERDVTAHQPSHAAAQTTGGA